MTKIEEAQILCEEDDHHMFDSEIMIEYCPNDFNELGPDCDTKSYFCNKVNGIVSFDTQGCRGITCKECWEKEV